MRLNKTNHVPPRLRCCLGVSKRLLVFLRVSRLNGHCEENFNNRVLGDLACKSGTFGGNGHSLEIESLDLPGRNRVT